LAHHLRHQEYQSWLLIVFPFVPSLGPSRVVSAQPDSSTLQSFHPSFPTSYLLALLSAGRWIWVNSDRRKTEIERAIFYRPNQPYSWRPTPSNVHASSTGISGGHSLEKWAKIN